MGAGESSASVRPSSRRPAGGLRNKGRTAMEQDMDQPPVVNQREPVGNVVIGVADQRQRNGRDT